MSCVMFVAAMQQFVLYVYLHVPLIWFGRIVHNGLYRFPLLILYSFSTFLHFCTPAYLHRVLLMSYCFSSFCWSCHYHQNHPILTAFSILPVIHPLLSLLRWEHLLYLMSVAVNDLVDESISWLSHFGILMSLTWYHSYLMSCHVICTLL